MNAPHDPSDPLFESLAEEAADLPARAASAARQRSAQRRQNGRRLTQTALIALVAVSSWQLIPRSDVQPTTDIADQPTLTHIKHSPEPDAAPFAPLPTKTVSQQPSVVNVAAALPLPSGLNEEQAEFVKALPDVPLLFIRDDTGKVTRIHLVER